MNQIQCKYLNHFLWTTKKIQKLLGGNKIIEKNLIQNEYKKIKKVDFSTFFN